MLNQVLDFIGENKNRYLESLKELIRIESISTQPEKKKDILACAEMIVGKFKEAGLENARLLETSGYPIVYADWLHSKGAPTVLIYGHYDVQPADPIEKWKSPPFEPTLRDGNLYARGTTDNKGQFFTYLCAAEAYLKTVGKLPVNIKFAIEGEEEVGSEGIMEYVQKNKEFLACDAVMVSDMPWYDIDYPTLSTSLKGIVYTELKVKGPRVDLHSGLFSCKVQNPVQALSWILAKLKDEKTQRVLIPGFYDDVLELTEEEKADFAAVPFNAKQYAGKLGVSELVTEEGYTPVEGGVRRPSLDICGIWGGYQDVGAKTIIPSEAGAKVSMRLVANQDEKKVVEAYKKYVHSLVPRGVEMELEIFQGAPCLMVDRNNPYIRKTAKAYGEAFGKKIHFLGEGGSIPVTCVLNKVLNAPVVLMGIGLPDDALHSPNEKIGLDNFFGGIKGAALAFKAFAE